MSFSGSEYGITADDLLDFHNIFGVRFLMTASPCSFAGRRRLEPESDQRDERLFEQPLAGHGISASDPYIVAVVGGTELELHSDASINKEYAWFLDATNNTGSNASGGGTALSMDGPWQEPRWGPDRQRAGGNRQVPDVAGLRLGR